MESSKRTIYLYTSLTIFLIFIITGSYHIFNKSVKPTGKLKPNLKPAFVDREFGPSIPKEPAALPNEWMGYQRMYPYNRIDEAAYRNSMIQVQESRQNRNERTPVWEQKGPYNIGGRITDIEIHPDSPETIYIATASGGIYKTTDDGETWQHQFFESPVISIGDMAIDPSNENILFAGTGEANSSSFSFLGNGIYKSEDGGDSWANSGLVETGYFGRIIVDYINPQRVYAAALGSLFTPDSNRGVYRSDDSGESWDQVLFLTDSTSAVDLVQDPVNPEVLYASMWERMRGLDYRRSGGESSGIYKTEDGGDTWFELTNGLPTHEFVGRIGLTISHSNPEVLYAFYDKQMEPGDSYSYLGIFKTTNGGTLWQQTNDSNLYDMNASFGWYFGQIHVDPSDENMVFALGVDLVRSTNGGETWQQIAGYWNTDEIHVDHHAIVIDPNTGRIAEGNDGGLYISDNYGSDWDHINNIPMTQFYAIEIDAQNPFRLYGGTQDNNTIRTFNGGADDWERILGGDGFYCIVDPENADVIYAESQWGNLHKSTNGGNNFFNISDDFSDDRKNWSMPIVMSPSNTNILFTGTYRIWKTTNGGSSWQAVSGDITQGGNGSGYHTVTTIAVSTINSGYILAGTDDGQVHISTTGGNFWTNISDQLPDRWITRVAFDPFDENRIYVTVSGFRWDDTESHIFISDDAGQNWTSIGDELPDIPVNVIIADPDSPGRLFVGTDAGIYVSHDFGENWDTMSNGMPAVPVVDLKIHNETRFLVAGTYGCSAYTVPLLFSNPGDINNDGDINVQDIVIMVNIIVNNYDPTPDEIYAGDLNEDGVIDILDIVSLVNLILEN
ncbi:MAG: hypothetical protein HN729_12925 [Candidatus Marinimicrobia bacterium]|jgi:photosystem II stability/assembly factor-like uncharacterized protein|nr:hypothetical protein [Candidatus Neomarinimicrobiota bacterium]MBT3634620.1 hypothetical protein [Candidatus Neomarinimicrobiota bacterium]MBT3682750.1 hypothetical protein [Candidatus Neomarinimicrobiota bacterium]MBT3759595.1 hypothetical protein [Candidatus Neomarinimicrobiota bacterium]MBT3894533.1 hypothetical protein [Candidatus Neomarinimicrobiota bacterium]